jgi:hypothetical protein
MIKIPCQTTRGRSFFTICLIRRKDNGLFHSALKGTVFVALSFRLNRFGTGALQDPYPIVGGGKGRMGGGGAHTDLNLELGRGTVVDSRHNE